MFAPCSKIRVLWTRDVVSYNLVPYTMYFCEAPRTYEHEHVFAEITKNIQVIIGYSRILNPGYPRGPYPGVLNLALRGPLILQKFFVLFCFVF
jgi:hypothetical protein